MTFQEGFEGSTVVEGVWGSRVEGGRVCVERGLTGSDGCHPGHLAGDLAVLSVWLRVS